MRNRNRIWQRGQRGTSARGALLLLATAIAFSFPAGAQGTSPAPPGHSTIAVGALLSLTGTWSSLGVTSQSALEIAAQDVNAQFARQGVAERVQVMVCDTQLNPDTALQQLKMLADEGIRIVIGPQSSAEVQALKPYADQHGIVLISQGSTASSLAIAGDNIFRFVPDDTHEAAAIAALMRADGIRTVVPVWRDDAGNRGLADSLRRFVQAGGGTVTDGVRYAANNQGPSAAPNFTAELQAVKSQVSQALAQSNASSVGVFLSPFDEAADLFRQVGADPVLSSVRWYGSDGIALSKVLTASPAAEFAAHVGYPCPIYALDDAEAGKWKPVADQILARTGVPADALALSAYDALWVAAMAAVQAGGNSDITAFKKAFVQIAGSYSGITGLTALNDAGDRQSGNYDFWAVCRAPMSADQPAAGSPGDAFAWTRVEIYKTLPDGTGTLLRLPGCN